MIYTGYYAKLKSYEERNIHPVAISGKVPDFYTGRCWKDLAPRFGMFQEWKRGEIDDFQYTQLYKEWLNGLDAEAFKGCLKELQEEYGDIVFLCYEKPGSFCHRHILADWIEEKLSLPVQEA